MQLIYKYRIHKAINKSDTSNTATDLFTKSVSTGLNSAIKIILKTSPGDISSDAKLNKIHAKFAAR